MSKRVMVVGEGPHEIGREGDAYPPALTTLLHRLLDEPDRVCYDSSIYRWKDLKHAIGRGSRSIKKVMWAIERAQKEGFDAVVILADQDRLSPKERAEQLAEGRDEMKNSTKAQYPSCAVGVAVEAFDAWMICDQKAIKAAGGNPDKFTSRPEDEKKPKKKAADIFNCPPDGTGLGQYYPVVAREIAAREDGLEQLRERCPQRLWRVCR
ncbi:MAG: DUF4276 family protein [Phycisphaerae bacterium]